MRPGGRVGSKRVRDTVLGNILLAGLCCFVVTSCKQADDGLSPEDPPPAASLSELFGSVLLQADGHEVGIATIEQKEIIAIYFEAQRCPVCAQFTPLLKSAYEKIGLAGKSFEVVIVSYDATEQEMLDHMTDAGMTWLAVPFGGGTIEALTLRYEVQFIPTVVVLDSDGNTISMNGRGDVDAKGALAYDDWLAQIGG